MSDSDLLASLGALTGAPGTPAVNPANEPANIRNGGAKAQQAYTTALQFEQVLVNQLTQQLTANAGIGGDGSSDDSSSDGSDSSSLLGSGPAASEYAQLLPGTLTSSIMGSGGLGNLADTLAAAIDPAINEPPTTSMSTAAAPTTPGATPVGGATA